MIKSVVEAFDAMRETYGAFFRAGTRDNSATARRYLQGLVQAENCTFSEMADVVEGGDEQQFQHFISNSPWRYEPVIEQIGRDADRLLGGQDESYLIIDESSFAKQGDRSAGVARQWSGRLGKVDNCQVAVFAVLSDGTSHTPVDMRLYLPGRWVDDPERCARAGIPEKSRHLVSKSGLALDIVRQARERGMRFRYVLADGGYGKEPAFLRALDDAHEVFVADVHKTQTVWPERPEIGVPAPKGNGKQPTKKHASTAPVTVENAVKALGTEQWQRVELRDSTRGKLRVDVAHLRVWVWDGEEEEPRQWHLIARREIASSKPIKYSLSNAPEGASTLHLARMQGHRFWVERSFEDAKGECGLADYQVTGWLAWHHHITLVMLAMLFILQQRVANLPILDLLSARDIVEILAETLPGKARTEDAIVARINRRHGRRQKSIDSRYRAQERRDRDESAPA